MKHLGLLIPLIVLTLFAGACGHEEPTQQPLPETPEIQQPDTVAPELMRISPTSAFPGAIVTLTGKGFGSDTSALRVTLAGEDVPVIGSDGNSVSVMLPQNAHSGPIRLYKNGDIVMSAKVYILRVLSILNASYKRASYDIHGIFVEDVKYGSGGGQYARTMFFNHAVTFSMRTGAFLDHDGALALSGGSTKDSAHYSHTMQLYVDPASKTITNVHIEYNAVVGGTVSQRIFNLQNLPFIYGGDGSLNAHVDSKELGTALNYFQASQTNGMSGEAVTRILDYSASAGATIIISPN